MLEVYVICRVEEINYVFFVEGKGLYFYEDKKRILILFNICGRKYLYWIYFWKMGKERVFFFNKYVYIFL